MDNIEQKQKYLRIQILEAGYDANDFIEYMSNYSPQQSPSLQNLTFNQLQKLVSAYKAQASQRNNQVPQQEKSATTEQSQKKGKGTFQEELLCVQDKKAKINYDKYGSFDYQFKGVMNCTQADKLIGENKIQIKVTELQTKQTEGYIFGIGSKVQYYYHIKTNLMKGTVKRQSEDFDWLNNTLLRLYPFLLLPELQPVRKDIKDPYVRRKKDIEQYLQHLCQKKYLLTSTAFVDFLTISSQKMQKYKKIYDSMGFAKGVLLMKTESGKVQLDLSNKSRDLYLHSSREFNRKTSQLHDSLAIAINKMIESYRTAIADTYVVVDLFAELHDSFSQMSNKFTTLKKEEYNDTLISLNNLFLGIGDNLKNITDTIEAHTRDYFRFYAGLDRNILKLQRLTKQSQTDYLQYKTNLQRKKQRVISDPSKWDIQNLQIDIKKLSKQQLMKLILPKQVLIENELKTWYAFNLKNYQFQLLSYLRFINKRYQLVFKTLAVELLSNDRCYVEAITKFVSQAKKGSIGHARPS